MNTSILVAYATRYGSTEEVAQSVTESLRGRGLNVEIKLARKVRSLSGYNAVVLSAPLYMFRWHRDALHFLSRHRAALTAMPTVIFALGPFHNKEEELRAAREQLDKELAKFPWLKPVVVEVFVGKFEPTKLRFPYSFIGPLKKIPPSDERDWQAIRAWADGITELLKETK